jgi:hypothetical protein
MPAVKVPNLSANFESSVKAATWLTKADTAQIEVARILISYLLMATDSREIVSLSKTLTEVLQHLGLNVAGRTGKAETVSEVSPLDYIKQRSAVRKSTTTPRKPATKSAKPRK